MDGIPIWKLYHDDFFRIASVREPRAARRRNINEVIRLTVGFIGAGKVGCTLGKYLSLHGVRVAGYHSRNTGSAEQAARFTGTAAYPEMGALVSRCDVLFLTVPDGSIPSVFEAVRRHPIRGKFICHCSGALSSQDAFPGIEDAGAFGYSVHPLFAVSDKYHAYEELADVFFALEGHPAHLDEMRELLAAAGLHAQVMDPAGKALYHCAAATASNLVTALIAHSAELLTRCGFSAETALSALLPLAVGNMRHIAEDGLVRSLTGPVERGDAGTIQKHLSSLDAPEDRELYTLLSRKLVPIAEEKHPERSYQSVKEVLNIRKDVPQ